MSGLSPGYAELDIAGTGLLPSTVRSLRSTGPATRMGKATGTRITSSRKDLGGRGKEGA